MRKSLHEEDHARRRCVIMSDIREDVRKKYAAAISARSGHACCGGRDGCGNGSGSGCDAITGGNYFPEDLPDLLQNMEIPTFGCGNPTAIASLRPGETVLDLGSGAGLDVLLAAVKVGPTGRVYGLDMTEEMLSEAERNRRRAGLENVTFLKGHMEEIPLPALSGRIPDQACSGSCDRDGTMPQSLQPGETHDRHQMSHMEAVSGGIEPDVSCYRFRFEKMPQLLGSAAPFDESPFLHHLKHITPQNTTPPSCSSDEISKPDAGDLDSHVDVFTYYDSGKFQENIPFPKVKSRKTIRFTECTFSSRRITVFMFSALRNPSCSPTLPAA
jgi:hypothetical protein